MTGRETLTESALEKAIEALETHPGYSADVTFAAIWTWLALKDATIAEARTALSHARSTDGEAS